MVQHVRKWKEGDPYLDEFDWNTMAEVLQDKDLSHNHSGLVDGDTKVDHDNLTNVTEDQHHPKHVKTLDDHPLSVIPTMDDVHIPDVETLSYGGAFALSQIPPLPSSKLCFGTWEKVVDYTVPSNTTTVTITGLDLDAGIVFMLIFTIKNPLGSTVLYYLYLNNDQTATNYYRQFMYASGNTIGGARGNDSLHASIDPNTCGLFEGKMMRTPDGYPRWILTDNRHLPANIQWSSWTHIYAVSANVTRIDVVAGTANGIGAGSRFILFKVSQ